jgi:hypothetical protein
MQMIFYHRRLHLVILLLVDVFLSSEMIINLLLQAFLLDLMEYWAKQLQVAVRLQPTNEIHL